MKLQKILLDYKKEYDNIKKNKAEAQEKDKFIHAESFRKDGENLGIRTPYEFLPFSSFFLSIFLSFFLSFFFIFLQHEV